MHNEPIHLTSASGLCVQLNTSTEGDNV